IQGTYSPLADGRVGQGAQDPPPAQTVEHHDHPPSGERPIWPAEALTELIQPEGDGRSSETLGAPLKIVRNPCVVVRFARCAPGPPRVCLHDPCCNPIKSM